MSLTVTFSIPYTALVAVRYPKSIVFCNATLWAARRTTAMIMREARRLLAVDRLTVVGRTIHCASNNAGYEETSLGCQIFGQRGTTYPTTLCSS